MPSSGPNSEGDSASLGERHSRSWRAVRRLTAIATRAAAAGERALAEANDLASIRRVADNLGSVRKIVAEVTRKRTEINKVAKVWLKAIRKGGVMLRQMAEAGERHGRGRMSPGVTLPSPAGIGLHAATRLALAARCGPAARTVGRDHCAGRGVAGWHPVAGGFSGGGEASAE